MNRAITLAVMSATLLPFLPAMWKLLKWAIRVKRAHGKVRKALNAMKVGMPQDQFDFHADQCEAALAELRREVESK